jgi:hypothetical protein
MPKHALWFSAITLALLAPLGRLSADEPVVKRVGNIYVTGNDTVSDAVVLSLVELGPGQEFSVRDLRTANERLQHSRFFVKDGTRITIVPFRTRETGSYRDLLVTVVESSFGKEIGNLSQWLDHALTVNLGSGISFDCRALVMEYPYPLDFHIQRILSILPAD